MDKLKNYLNEVLEIFYNMFKYQIITKTILFTLISPIFWSITNILIKNKEISILKTDDILNFIFSIKGVIFLIISIFFIIITFLLEIYAYIFISYIYIVDKKEPKFKSILKNSIKIVPNLIKGSLILVIYLALLIPLFGFNIGVSLFNNFKIPNFVLFVIFSNNIYYSIYIIFLILITIIVFMSLFLFHYIVLFNYNIIKSIRLSFILVMKNYKDILYNFIYLFIFIVLGFLVIFSPLFITLLITYNIKFINIFLTLMFSFISLLISFVTIPLFTYFLTKLFHNYTKVEISYEIEEKDKLNIIDKIFSRKKSIIILVISILIIISLIFSTLLAYDYNITNEFNNNLKVVAHRAGIENENTLSSIKLAIEKKVDYVEIDVQRTKDKNYILNHDKTFYRVANVDKKPSDMTLQEIKNLKIDVPTLEEVLKISKDKIGIFIELKGETADNEMVDYVVNLVNKYNMKNQVILMSLNYDNIVYIENKYTEFVSGYTYFFALGDVTKLKGDYLIIEESLATKKNIKDIHNANKKVAIWTVNTDSSMDNMFRKNVDAVITDYYDKFIFKINEYNKKTTFEKFLHNFNK